MKKQDLLQHIDDELLDKLFGFCYARTSDSYEAESLCSDILFAIVKSARRGGEISDAYPFIWRVARNVYADYSEKRRRATDNAYIGDPEEILLSVAEEDGGDEKELISHVMRRIAFLTRAYREVMIEYYLDGMTTAAIAKRHGIGEGTVRQRLFAARQKIKSEVEEMNENNKPLMLDKVKFVIWGTGNPGWGDPRDGFCRMLSNHAVWLCLEKPRTAAEIAEILNVPTVYIEEELELLVKGGNGKYGILRKLDNGKYGINIVLLKKEAFEEANALYIANMAKITDVVADFIEEHKEEYLSFPYINKTVTLNLILWQQIKNISSVLSRSVNRILREKHFAGYEHPNRPFTVYGYESNGRLYGGGLDGTQASNICGYSEVDIQNIYVTRIKTHFSCGHNISTDPLLQLAIRAIEGLSVDALAEADKEHTAKAVECGYLYRDGGMLYTKILVCEEKDADKLYNITKKLYGQLDAEAEVLAEKMAELIKRSIPEYLYGEWVHANSLADLPVQDALIEALIERGILTPPENGVGAEGCWMSVKK